MSCVQDCFMKTIFDVCNCTYYSERHEPYATVFNTCNGTDLMRCASELLTEIRCVDRARRTTLEQLFAVGMTTMHQCASACAIARRRARHRCLTRSLPPSTRTRRSAKRASGL